MASEPKATSAGQALCPQTTPLGFMSACPLHVAGSAGILVPSGATFPPSVESKAFPQLAMVTSCRETTVVCYGTQIKLLLGSCGLNLT